DRDLFQAVDAHTAVVELRRDGPPGTIDAAGVEQRSGVTPAQIPDLIALRGDPSDGLPGAPGIGAKTAAELLSTYGSLEAVLAAASAGKGPDQSASAGGGAVRAPGGATRPDMRPRVAAALRDNSDLILAFKRIATLQRIEVQRPADRRTDFAGGSAMARELGMRRLAERLRGRGRRG
ncbi:MAG TPA: 5'-3' exonuclease H3TH domain-containing protein, partial [Solirubrobacteraceae bacterium]|nr:5'-3' exonuclease H3TH domain-containing protein [Solirubrobacteraceae bacterium]